MTKNLKTPGFASTHSTQVVKARRDGSRTLAASATSFVHAVTPTSKRIIKETSVERRKAMKVLANRKAHYRVTWAVAMCGHGRQVTDADTSIKIYHAIGERRARSSFTASLFHCGKLN